VITPPDNPPYVIAEIGCNHRGEMDTARKMIQVAATYAEAHAVKFQKRNAKELLTPEEYNRPQPNQAFAYGPTYGAHREALEFDVAQHRELKALCDELGIEYSTSVWDLTSARECIALEPRWLKVPSACNLNRQLLSILADEFSGQLHISLGMTTPAEQDQIVEFLVSKNRARDTVLYSCTSGYPVAFEDVCLLEISRLIDKYRDTVGAIGFSGHHLGISVDVAAMVLGAQYIERHFTLDRTWKGTDHAASLEPDGIRRLVRDTRAVHAALRYKASDILDVEQVQRDKLKSNQVKW